MNTSTLNLRQEIVRARAVLWQVRQKHAVRSAPLRAVDESRQDLVDVLEAYIAGLAADGVPVPYRLRDELRLHTALLPTPRR